MMFERLTLSMLGQAIGAIALMIAVLHFAFGPFEPKVVRPLEQVIAERAAAVRDAAIAAAKGQKSAPAPQLEHTRLDRDVLARGVSTALGGIAVILGAIGFARRNPWRDCAVAVGLGCAAIGFQFVTIAIGIIVVIAVLSAVVNMGLW